MIKCFKNKKTKGRKLKFMERKFMKAMVLEKPCTAERNENKNCANSKSERGLDSCENKSIWNK